MKRFVVIAVFLAVCCRVNSRDQKPDSLRALIRNAAHDTVKCGHLIRFINQENDPAVWVPLNRELLTLCDDQLKKKDLSAAERFVFRNYHFDAMVNEAFRLQEEGKADSALAVYKKCEQDALVAKNDMGLSTIYNNMSFIFEKRGLVEPALEYLHKSLRIQEASNNVFGLSRVLNNLAFFYENLKDKEKALEFYFRSLKLKESLNDRQGISVTLNNIGSLYIDMLKYVRAEEYLLKSLELSLSIKDTVRIANTLNSLGRVYLETGRYKEAKEYLNKAYEKALLTNDAESIAYILLNTGHCQTLQNELDASIVSLSKSMEIAKRLGYPMLISGCAYRLKVSFTKKGNYQKALEFYELYVQMNDSIHSESNRKSSIRSQLKYEYEKQAAADSVAHARENEVKSAELSKQSAELKAKKNQQYALFGGLFGVCVFGVFMFNRYKVTQKQKGIIELQKLEVENQKLLVEHKQKEILDSIHYARKIQLAQIPSEKRVLMILEKMRGH